MRATPERIINRLFGNRSAAAVEKIVDSPPIQNWLAEIDGAEVARRAALLKQLQDLPAKHEKGCVGANKELERAKQALDAAHEGVKTATVAYGEAYGHAMALSIGYDRERSTLEREIERSADPRIWQFVCQLLDLYGIARQVQAVPVTERNGKFSHYDASIPIAAMESLDVARDAAKALIWQSLTTEQVTRALERIRADLDRPLKAVNLAPPLIDGEQILASLMYLTTDRLSTGA